MVAAIKGQADRPCTLGPIWASDVRGEAAKMITDVAPEGLNHVLFTNAGTEAIEHATRMARIHTGRPKLLAAYRSYHGATTTSMHLTGDHRRWATDTGAAGAVHFFGPYLYRSEFGSSTPNKKCEGALDHLAHVIAMEGPATIAALVLESVIGGSGVIPPPAGYLEGVRELCIEHGIVYIADEVMVGSDRPGSGWHGPFAGVLHPDLIAFAKGVNSGYVPLGDVLSEIPSTTPWWPGTTPVALPTRGIPSPAPQRSVRSRRSAGRGMIASAARLGAEVCRTGWASWQNGTRGGSVRGIGALWALDLVAGSGNAKPLVPYAAAGPAFAPMAELGAACLERGLIVFPSETASTSLPL